MFFYTIYKNKTLRLQFIVNVASLLYLFLSFNLARNSESLIIWSQLYSSTSMTIIYLVIFYINYKNMTQYNPEFEFGLYKIQSISTLLASSALFIYFIFSTFQAIQNLSDPGPFEDIEKALAINSIYVLIDGLILKKWNMLDKTKQSETTIAYKQYYEKTFKYDLLFYVPLLSAYLAPNYFILAIIDSIYSAMLCFVNIKMAFGDGKAAIFELLDTTLDEANQLIIVKYLAKHFDSYTAYHGQNTRQIADLKYITLFLEFDKNKTMNEIFNDTKALESDLEQAILGAQVCIVPTDEKIVQNLSQNNNKICF